jgi:predicted dinucleotide-binding enzyme
VTAFASQWETGIVIMKTAIISLRNIGSRLASKLMAGGEGVIISGRNLAKAEQLAAKLGASSCQSTMRRGQWTSSSSSAAALNI